MSQIVEFYQIFKPSKFVFGKCGKIIRDNTVPVDDDRGDLLVHEEQHSEEEGGEGGQEVNVPGGLIIKHGDQPVSDIRASGLKIVTSSNQYQLGMRRTFNWMLHTLNIVGTISLGVANP